MTEKFKILAKFIKDASSETPDVETYLFVKDNISKYQLNIDINSKALKNKLIEVNTSLKFEDKEPNEKKSYYEIIYTTVIKVNENVKEETTNITKPNTSFKPLVKNILAPNYRFTLVSCDPDN